MSITFTVPDNYGYVLLVASLAGLGSTIHGISVGRYRKAAKIPYPNAYATPQQAADSQDAYLFNCAQRAHANYLENQSSFVTALFIAGLKFPMATTALGVAWLVNRWIYAIGYTSRTEKNGRGRLKGTLWMACHLALLGLSFASGAKLLLD